MAFSPVTSNKLYIQIYNQIRDAITTGLYKPGDKLPSEKEFCQMFNVSRVPVREALCALELNGLVTSNQGAGVYVKEAGPAPDLLPQEMDPQDIIQVRMVLEPEVARAAAQNIGPAEKLRLNEIVAVFRSEAEADAYSDETDRDFHMCIARASGNQMYMLIYDLLWKAMEQKMWDLILRRTVASDRYRQANYQEHLQIAQAIMDSRAQDAYTIMKAHMDRLQQRYWN